jgi:formylglycine-generating enzyme required for sulfatase activity
MSEILDLKHRIKNNEGSVADADEFEFEDNGKKRKFSFLSWLIVIIVAVVLTTAGIKASDSLFGAKGEDNSLCPAEMVFVPGSNGGFCLDKYENSAGGQCPNSNPASEVETQANINYADCQAVSAAGAIPWRNLTQIQAVNLCAKAGKRLPTSEEWFAASLGTPDKNADWGSDDCQVNNNWKQQPGLSGSGKNCVSYAGAYDMVGNVWEWVKGEVDNGLYGKAKMPDNGYIQAVSSDGLMTETDPDNPAGLYNNDYLWIKKDGARGLARGGYWANGAAAGGYSLYAVTELSAFAVGSGFRCVK